MQTKQNLLNGHVSVPFHFLFLSFFFLYFVPYFINFRYSIQSGFQCLISSSFRRIFSIKFTIKYFVAEFYCVPQFDLFVCLFVFCHRYWTFDYVIESAIGRVLWKKKTVFSFLRFIIVSSFLFQSRHRSVISFNYISFIFHNFFQKCENVRNLMK